MFGVIVSALLFDSIFLILKKNYLLSFGNIVALSFIIFGLSNYAAFFSESIFSNYFVHEYAFFYGVIAGVFLSGTERVIEEQKGL